jgi:hypothetical protein
MCVDDAQIAHSGKVARMSASVFSNHCKVGALPADRQEFAEALFATVKQLGGFDSGPTIDKLVDYVVRWGLVLPGLPEDEHDARHMIRRGFNDLLSMDMLERRVVIEIPQQKVTEPSAP